jgi:Family of unknown function (DUF5947)
MHQGKPDSAAAVVALRRFASRQAIRQEVCDLCGTAVAADHQHLIDPTNRRILCACEACAILFDHRGAKFTRVPRRVSRLAAPVFSDAQWDALSIPIGMAFFFFSSPLSRIVAMYPGPAGATESLLSLETWHEALGADSPVRDLQANVEALLVNRVGRRRDYIVPIDVCYRLVGLIRSQWRGFGGGTEAWEAIDRFYEDLDARGDESFEAVRA